jgi:hypothetical protein
MVTALFGFPAGLHHMGVALTTGARPTGFFREW